jgi:capsular polysaccharide export protein
MFLQGVASPFFDQLANALFAENSAVYKINFCGGDCFYWRKKPVWNFTDTLHNLPEFIEEKFSQFQFTDIVLFGDMRPVHIPAIAIAKKYHAKIWVFEEGYIRPHWLTLEMNGVNANSSLPRNPDYYLTQAKQIPNYQEGLDTDYSLMTRFYHDVQYNVARYAQQQQFSHYQLHRPQSVLDEYLGWIKRLPIQKTIGERHANQVFQNLIRGERAFFLFPLQLHFDAQIVHHSPFSNIEQAISIILRSFSLYADKEACIVLKNHPLDIGTINYLALIEELKKKLNLNNRVIFIDGGDLVQLVKRCTATITINSTVGITALSYNCPVMCLGKSIYHLKGLTFQGGLDDFWNQYEPPDSLLFNSFKKIVVQQTQINGNFYTQTGIKMAVFHSVKRILSS